ncbi:iron ABC transporter permease [Natroniella acetigena]|uniref:FecCD family ABC transporter permease n=1 Tax=Natroniella acetigena TaxID=52004 RepID=UPI00200AAFAF|nr:iron ABC transporter permease [Natroniella acetigena]MCK8827285.1 iron ABC transporter permease [Natroniella acetigena]
MSLSKEKDIVKLWSVAVLLVVIFTLSLFLGRYNIPPLELLELIRKLITGQSTIEVATDNVWTVFYYIRLPRVILVTGVGAVLAITGTAYQSIFRNPLVSPDLLGVSAGSCFGVALGMVLTDNSLTTIYLLAFIFGVVAVGLAYFIAVFGKGEDIMMMVLGGILVTSLFNASISILKYLADPYEKLPGIVFWLMGGFSRTGWSEVKFTLPFMVLGITIIYILRWYLNVLSMGEEEAISLGVDAKALRLVIIVITTLMVAAAVATTGQVTWIGLVVPHIARYLIGSDHRLMLPTAALLGSTLLLLMDNLARCLTTVEIPISIITAFLGAPFFAYLLISRQESGWN